MRIMGLALSSSDSQNRTESVRIPVNHSRRRGIVNGAMVRRESLAGVVVQELPEQMGQVPIAMVAPLGDQGKGPLCFIKIRARRLRNQGAQVGEIRGTPEVVSGKDLQRDQMAGSR